MSKDKDMQFTHFDEQGNARMVDVGAKAEIYRIIEEMAAKGAAVILVSSDNEELARVATRILIMRRGNIVGEFNSGMPDRQRIAMTASGLQM